MAAAGCNERDASDFPLQPLHFCDESRGQLRNQGLDVAHLMLNRQHRDALRHKVIYDEVLPRRNHQKRRRTVLPQAALLRVGGSNAHGRVQIGEVLVGNAFAPFTSRPRVDAAQIQRRIAGQQERGG